MIELPDHLVAHTPAPGSTKWHSLEDHSIEVAELARQFAEPFGGGDAAYLTGLLHDAGKAHPDFQDYLRKCAEEPKRKPKSVDHKTAGAIRVPDKCGLPQVMFGHHGGLSNAGDISSKIRYAISEDRERMELSWQLFLSTGLDIPQRLPEFPDWVKKGDTSHEFFLRMLFSCLVDADVLSTEAHWDPAHSRLRNSDLPSLNLLWEQFETSQLQLTHLSQQQNREHHPVNVIRKAVYESCIEKAQLPPGFFRLTVPTGGGKTRSSTAFALKHALNNDLKRVVFAVPFLTITEQTVDVLRNCLGNNRAVLEHHSGVDPLHEDADGDQQEDELWRRLVGENWDARIVVTTTVQLFESLLGRGTSKCRKLHNICDSVLILDEFQTIPVNLRAPIFDVLKMLVQHCRVTVVLCTATQPILDTIQDELTGGGIDVVELAPDPEQAFRVLDRVLFEWPAFEETWSWERAAEEMWQSEQCLTIVNTIANASALFEALDDPDALHLSTRMCGEHRRAVMEGIRSRLRNNLPCRVVSTQLVEAGVDVDFPVVLRALAPLDRIAQAAGRCNREGLLSHKGRVVVFAPEEGGMPMESSYKHGTSITGGMHTEVLIDFTDPDTFNIYFSRLFVDQSPDKEGIQPLRKALEFEQVADTFKMIDDTSIAVVVPYADESAQLLKQFDDRKKYKRSMGDLYRRVQPYVVSVPCYHKPKLETAGLLVETAPGLWQWKGSYDCKMGIRIDKNNALGLDPELLLTS